MAVWALRRGTQEEPRVSRRLPAVLAEQVASPVHLHGFINAGKPAALLLIEGQVVPLAAGESYRGVTVRNVAPPAVALQRGTRTWTVSLSDQVARRPAEKTAAD